MRSSSVHMRRARVERLYDLGEWDEPVVEGVGELVEDDEVALTGKDFGAGRTVAGTGCWFPSRKSAICNLLNSAHRRRESYAKRWIP